MKSEVKYCPHCNGKMVIYVHSMSELIARALDKFTVKSEGSSCGLIGAGLTFSERTNFQKLRYWDLVGKGDKSGEWRTTDRGIQFLNGEIMVPEKAMTFRGSRTSYDGCNVSINELIPEGSKTREEYAREAIPMKVVGEQLALCR